MGIFTGFNEATVGGKGVWFLDGLYQVTVNEILVKVSRKKDTLYIIECKITKSTCPGRTVGMTCSQVINMKQDAAMGNVKAFIAAACGFNPKMTPEEYVAAGITEEVAEYSYHKDQPYKGKHLDLEAVTVDTREVGGKYTVHNWAPFGTIQFPDTAVGLTTA